MLLKHKSPLFLLLRRSLHIFRFLYFRYKYGYRFSTGREQVSVDNRTRETPSLHCWYTPLQYTSLGYTTQKKPHMEAPGCTTSVSQKDFGVVFHLSCLTIGNSSCKWEIKILRKMLGSEDSSHSCPCKEKQSWWQGLHLGVVGHEEAARHTGQAVSPRHSLLRLPPSPPGSVFSHHTCAESSAFQGLLFLLPGTGDGFRGLTHQSAQGYLGSQNTNHQSWFNHQKYLPCSQ